MSVRHDNFIDGKYIMHNNSISFEKFETETPKYDSALSMYFCTHTFGDSFYNIASYLMIRHIFAFLEFYTY